MKCEGGSVKCEGGNTLKAIVIAAGCKPRSRGFAFSSVVAFAPCSKPCRACPVVLSYGGQAFHPVHPFIQRILIQTVVAFAHPLKSE